MSRRIALMHVVDRFDQAATEELSPRSIHYRPSEVRVVHRSDPASEGQPTRHVGLRRWFSPAQEFRRAKLRGVLEFIHGHAGIVANHAGFLLAPVGVLDLGEERRYSPIVALLPTGERMIVALRTIEPHAEKVLRCQVGQLGRRESLAPLQQIFFTRLGMRCFRGFDFGLYSIWGYFSNFGGSSQG